MGTLVTAATGGGWGGGLWACTEGLVPLLWQPWTCLCLGHVCVWVPQGKARVLGLVTSRNSPLCTPSFCL